MNISVDQLLEKSENKFLLSNALGQRAKQISEGSLPYVDDFNPTNSIVTAMKEIAFDKVKIKVLKGPEIKAKAALKEEKKERPKLSLAKEKKKKSKKSKKK